MNKSISILIGAGFSAPMGYPIGNQLNELLLKTTETNFIFTSDGILISQKEGKKFDLGYKTDFDISFEFCLSLIQLFNKKKGYFDYEEFYDFLLDESHSDPDVDESAKPFQKIYFKEKSHLLNSLKNIYNQLVSFYLKDGIGKKWYDDEPHMTGAFPGYTGISNYFKLLGETYSSINIHTLNHDMLLERMNRSDAFAGELCDGFEELGSPFYGKLYVNNRVYATRLQHYTGNYRQKYKLYKLHGSFDYGVYYASTNGVFSPETYIKTRYGIGFGDFNKEKLSEEGILIYENCWVNYHADFLTGTTSKIERYAEPLLYKKLFSTFRDNLKEADALVIIGYGGKDAEVNRMLLENFDYEHKPSFIVDPYAGSKVKELRKKLNASLVEKQLDDLEQKDFSWLVP